MRVGAINQHALCRVSHVDFPGRNSKVRWAVARGLHPGEPEETTTYLRCKEGSQWDGQK